METHRLMAERWDFAVHSGDIGIDETVGSWRSRPRQPEIRAQPAGWMGVAGIEPAFGG